MTYLAFRNLFQQKFRLTLSVSGVALAIMLILLLNGFLAGIYAQVTAYLDHTPADLMVAQDGVTNMLSATSLLPASAEDLARGVPGIARTVPIVSQFVILDIHDRKVVAYLVGYDPDLGGGPWALKAGRAVADDDEVVLDWVMAEKHNFDLGDTIEILSVDKTSAPAQATYDGRVLYFCARGCRDEFLEAPECYLTEQAKTRLPKMTGE